MPKMLDRRRLKDRIIESISKAVKRVQEQHICCPKGHKEPLSNGHWSVNKLCEHLDHAFLHGLRHITNGYWVVVKEFTHKAVVKEISKLQHVSTHLGRGRSWLYMALNDQLLECYLRCFMANTTLVRKFYVREALVMDQQQMELLITLASGLEFVCFHLEVDLPYLDLSSSMPAKERPRAEIEEDSADSDQMSLCSMDSSLSQGSLPTIFSVRSQVDGDSGSQRSSSSPHYSLLSALDSSSSVSGCDITFDENAEIEYAQSALDTIEIDPVFTRENSRFSQIDTNYVESDLDFENSSVEVIHVKSKVTRARKKKAHRKNTSKNTAIAHSSEFLAQRISISDKLTDAHTIPCYGSSDGDREQMAGIEINQSTNDLQSIYHVERSVVSSKDASNFHSESKEQSLLNPSLSSKNEAKGENAMKSMNGLDEKVKNSPAVLCLSKPDISELGKALIQNKDNAGACSSELDRVKLHTVTDLKDDIDAQHVQNEDNESEEECKGLNRCVAKSDVMLLNDLQSVQTESIEKDSVSTAGFYENVEKPANNILNSVQCYESENKEKDFVSVKTKTDLVTTNSIQESPDSSSAGRVIATASSVGNSTVPILSDSIHSQVAAPNEKTKSSVLRSEIKVDNNALLWLMLEVFEDEEEQFVKMFITSQGHTLGEIERIYVLLTSTRIYLLTREAGESKYKKQSTIKYSELDFISLSLNYQVINLVCTNRRKQFWLTTGDQTLTKCIVGHMDNVVRHSEQDLPRLSVLTDATTQKISMKKFVAAECGCQSTEVSLLCYSLVHWEDLNSSESSGKSGSSPRARHEGVLQHKSHFSYFSSASWKPFYFVLRDGVLYQYPERGGSAGPVMSIQLGTGQVAGCKRSLQSDREYSFELVLSDGASFQLSAANDTDAQDWLISLCRAVAEGQGVSVVAHDCLACCLVLTQHKVLLCHEDVQTNFFRLLGSANVTDVTSILVDAVSNTYCVLEFESQEVCVSSEKWALYFNSSEERDKFISVLSHAWTELFQVAIPVIETEDLVLQKKCREGVAMVKAIFRNTAAV